MPPRPRQPRPWPAALLLLAVALPLGPAPAPGTAHGAPPEGGWPFFTNVTGPAGLGGFLHAGYLGGVDNHEPRPLFIDIIGSGACWLDFDRDGWLDLYLVNQRYATRPENNSRDPHGHLFRGLGDGTFADVSAASGADLRIMGMGCAAADYDNDGDPDLFVTGWNGNVLLRNEGDGTFANVTAQAGVQDARCGLFACWNTSASWFDADRDGCLDLYVDRFGDYDPEHPTGNGPESAPGQNNTFYRGHCDGTFTNVTHAAGLGGEHSNSWSSVAADLDHDGWVDLYVSNDGDENDFYRNDGDGTFTRLNGTGTNNFRDGVQRHGMGTAVGDGNNDGRWDIVTTNFVLEQNGVFLGSPSGWVDVGSGAPFTDALDWSGWATHWTDLDNDAWPELSVVNGMTENLIQLPADEPQLLYQNRQGQFRVARDDVGPDLARDFVGRAGAWGDYDNDGDADLLLTEGGEAPVHLMRLDRAGGTFLSVDLVGAGAGGRDALGATVRVTAPGLPQQMQVKASGAAFLGNHDPRLHFGLAAARTADVEVAWPDGTTQAWTGLRANTFVRLTQGQAAAEAVREAPFVELLGPPGGPRREVLDFTAVVEPAGGAGVARVAWDFGDGATAGGTTASHAYSDVGWFTVSATATDTLGRTRTQSRAVFITDTLAATIEPDAPAFLPHAEARGNVTVRFSDGDPVPGAEVRLVVRTGTGSASLDAALDALPPEAQQLAGRRTFTLDLVSGPDGRAPFTVPWTLVGPKALVQPQANLPGAHHLQATGGARGSGFPPAEARYTIGAVALPELP